jgi:anaerobic magnesium-protoporphyrin IX monomethyl ester cyclase
MQADPAITPEIWAEMLSLSARSGYAFGRSTARKFRAAIQGTWGPRTCIQAAGVLSNVCIGMNTYLLNPTLREQSRYIREGRCMQKAASWATAWPPVTLAALGALARRKGAARLLDGNVEDVTFADLLRDVEAHKTDLVVINTGFPSIDSDMAVAERLKQALPEVKVAAFGVYFSLLEKEAMANHPFLDFAMVGEPEVTFAELLEALCDGAGTFEHIDGLAYRDSGGIHLTAPRALIQDLDGLPYPDRDLLRNDSYRLPHNNAPYTLINSARGCPYRCTYCIVGPYFGNRVRRHSLDYILREMETCVDRYGIREFLFWEEVFTLDREYVMGLCREIRARGLSIKWAATTRVTSVEEEMLAAMKDAGCYLLGLGIESSSQKVLDLARKKQTLADTTRAVALCKKAGIKTMGHCIFGLPGETRETADRTIDYMVRLGLDYMQSYCAVPYPKTELGELARSKGWIRGVRWSQYDFGGDSIMDTDTLTRQEVSAFRRKAFRRFYLRPRYLVKNLLGTFSLRRLLRLSAFGGWMSLLRKGKERENGGRSRGNQRRNPVPQ